MEACPRRTIERRPRSSRPIQASGQGRQSRRIGGVLGLMATEFSYDSAVRTLFFGIPLVAAATCFVAALYSLSRSHVGHEWEYIPCPADLRSFYDGLQEHYRGDPIKLRDDFTGFLTGRYVKAADANTNVNDRKSEFVHQANTRLVLTIALAMLCAVSYVIDKGPLRTDRSESAARASHSQMGDRTMSRPDDRPQAPTAPPPPRPAEPANRIVKEGNPPPAKKGC